MDQSRIRVNAAKLTASGSTLNAGADRFVLAQRGLSRALPPVQLKQNGRQLPEVGECRVGFGTRARRNTAPVIEPDCGYTCFLGTDYIHIESVTDEYGFGRTHAGLG